MTARADDLRRRFWVLLRISPALLEESAPFIGRILVKQLMRLPFALAFCFLTTVNTELHAEQTVRVYILAGQSNMEGQGVVDLDHPQHYNGGKGILNDVMKQSPERYQHLKDSSGRWVVRDDVFVRFQTRDELKRGGLTIGFTGYGGKHHIGPELQFGHVVGDQADEPVLLVKTAWGGKSLSKDFRPPSAEGETGEYYTRMIKEVHESIDNMDADFPSLKGRKPEIAGFVWFQGWNDMFDDKALSEYEQNLVFLIHDVREELAAPDLPVVIGELGNGGEDVGENMKKIRAAQRSTAARPEFSGTVGFVTTTAFARPKEQSPNVGHGHHWFGNAESYFLVGDALGKKMLELR